MQMIPGLTPCEITVHSPPKQNLGIGHSMALASFMVDGLYMLCWMGAFILLTSFFLVFYIFAEDSHQVIANILPVVIFYIIYRIGVNITFKIARPRLISLFLRIIKQTGQNHGSDVNIMLINEALQLQTERTRLVINWDEVESIIENEQGFLIELLNKPDVGLPKEELPVEWQSYLSSRQA